MDTVLRNSLPVQLTSFVGREQESAAVCTLLRRTETRLLTLFGVAGVGKTRLALQVADSLADEFDSQVYCASLAATSDPELVIPTIAMILGLQELGQTSILEHLKAFLKEKRLLLVLDNFEQVGEAASVLGDLLDACLALKILVTSRAILRISGEYTFLVPPLALPDPAKLPAKEDLLQYSAITLFLERGRAILPEFVLNEENSQTIAEICLHLDGLPLAIELAVPRLRILSPQMLLKRLSQRFQVLTYGMRNAPERQQTLYKTLEWSYRLLKPGEQQLFRFLAVFVGGCTLQALETTWELAGYAQEKEPVLDRVASLLDKSMLSCSIEQMGESRLFLLRTLRDYGLHCLALAGELEPFQRVHATYYLALAEEAEPQLKGSQPRQWLELLQREHENLREAFSYFITLGEREKERGTEMALRMGNALERFWVIGGHVKEGRNLLERALKRDWEVPGPLRGRALCLLSTLARYQADYPAAIAACQASLALFREMDDTAGIVNTLCRLGYVIWMQGDFCKAREYYEESLVLSQGGQCQEARSEALYYFASMTFFQGDMSLAHRLIEESLDLCRELGDKYTMALALNMRGLVALFERDVRAAQTFQQESLTLSRELGNQRAMAFALAGLGEVAFLMDDFPRACACYEESLSISLQLNGLWIPAISLTRLARVAIAMGDAIWAVRLFSAAETLRQALGVLKTIPLEKEEYVQAISTLHGLLDEPSFATAWAEGKKMSLEQAVAARGREEQAASSSLLKAKPIARRVSLPRSLHDDLTQREKEVLRLVAQGLTNAQVAADLVMSDRTVNFHLTSIYRKLQVSSRSGATRYVLEYHLFEE